MGITSSNSIDLSNIGLEEENEDKEDIPLSQDQLTMNEIMARDKADKQVKDKEKREARKRGEKPPPKEVPPAKVLKLLATCVANGMPWEAAKPTTPLNGYKPKNQ